MRHVETRQATSTATPVRAPLFGFLVVLSSCGPVPASPKAPERTYRFVPPQAELDCPLHDATGATGRCSPTSLDACLRDVNASPSAETPASRAAYRTLQQACLDQGACACAQFGDALTRSSEPERQLEGLNHLEDACKAGVLDACDEGLLLASLCSANSKPAYCEVLRRAGVVPAADPEPVWLEAALPAELHGCREGRVELGIVMPCPDVVGEECRVGQPDHSTLSVCVEAARVYWKADDWDVKSIHWETHDAGPWRAVDDRGDVVLTLVGKGSELQLRSGDAVLRRVPRARADVLEQEIAKLPTTQEMCVAAAACRRALDEASKDRGDAPDLEGEAIEDSLSTCRKALDEARVQLEAVNPGLASQRCRVKGSQ